MDALGLTSVQFWGLRNALGTLIEGKRALAQWLFLLT